MDREEIDRRLLQATCHLAVATMHLIKATKAYFAQTKATDVEVGVVRAGARQRKPEDVAADALDDV